MSPFFLFKRAIGALAQPLPLTLGLLLAALFLYSLGVWRKPAWLCLFLAFAVLAASSLAPFVRPAARTLEGQYEPFLGLERRERPPYAILVLGSGVEHPGDAALPALSRLNHTARARLVEGVRLTRLYPEAQLITSGHNPGQENCADAMAVAAAELGVPPERILRLPEALDTEHEAELAKKIVGDRPLLLVTSATHMPRAMENFRRRGIDALPAPCDFAAPYTERDSAAGRIGYYWPRGGNLAHSEKISREYLGLAYISWFKDNSSRR